MEQIGLRDFFGTPALDYGTFGEMSRKYGDKYFILVTNQPPPPVDWKGFQT